MRLGIDFGTTRIVVAAADRGNFPVVRFETPSGESVEWFPALIACGKDGSIWHGWRAWAAQADPAATVVRSLKRSLGDAGPHTRVQIAGFGYTMLDLLTGLCTELRIALQERLKPDSGEPLEVLLGVPANGNGNQRFLTAEAFRLAGFQVLGLLNEPSAASVEFGNGLKNKQAKARDTIVVYDLGGGTFDVSLVEVGESRHEVIASEGIPSLGGDDFDEVLAELALAAAAIPAEDRDALTQAELFRLHEECRQAKESLHPNTRRITIDLEQIRAGWPSVSVPVDEFYERAQPMVDETIRATADLLSSGRGGDLEALYVTGGASELPLVGRALREHFGRRVRRSAYARSATAIGLAIQADASQGYELREKFTRYFGVWREGEEGRQIVFDSLFAKGTPLPASGQNPLEVRRRYNPAHNVGHLRYLECSHTADTRPSGEITFWDGILFPLDASLHQHERLQEVPVVRMAWENPPEIEERYACDASGTVTVTIADLGAGFERSYRLGRWSTPTAPVIPGRKRAKRAVASKKSVS